MPDTLQRSCPIRWDDGKESSRSLKSLLWVKTGDASKLAQRKLSQNDTTSHSE